MYFQLQYLHLLELMITKKLQNKKKNTEYYKKIDFKCWLGKQWKNSNTLCKGITVRQR